MRDTSFGTGIVVGAAVTGILILGYIKMFPASSFVKLWMGL